MREIPLSQGKVALVDDGDFEWLSTFCWRGVRSRDRVYAATYINNRTVRMHRLILGLQPGQMGDHINNLSLDNQRHNLRVATFAGNMQNREKPRCNQSGFKGVVWYEKTSKWRVQIRAGHERVSLGYFDDPRDAALAYDRAALRLHGEFARTNF